MLSPLLCLSWVLLPTLVPARGRGGAEAPGECGSSGLLKALGAGPGEARICALLQAFVIAQKLLRDPRRKQTVSGMLGIPQVVSKAMS